jgi:3-oxoacyl-[acyl-carrier protein] reductase
MDLGLAGKVVLMAHGDTLLQRSLARSFLQEGAQVIQHHEGFVPRALGSGAPHAAPPASLIHAGGSLMTPELIKDECGNKVNLDEVDVLVYTPAAPSMRGFLTVDAEKWHSSVTDELKKAASLARQATRGMVRRKGGRVVFITSCAGIGGAEESAELSALGMGLIGFAKCLSRELISYGVTVNCIAHGLMEYELEAYSDKLKSEIPKLFKYSGMKRLGTCDDLCAGALFLASERTSYLTGQTLNINGGLII